MASKTNIAGFLFRFMSLQHPCAHLELFSTTRNALQPLTKRSVLQAASIFLQIFWPPHPLSHASNVAFYVECERIFVVMVMQGARAVAQMSWKYPRRPPNSHEYPAWRMMRVWAVKYVHLGSSENPKTHHTQHASQQLQILCQFSSASTKSSQTL